MDNATIANEQSLLLIKKALISAADKIIMLSNHMLENIKSDTSLAYMFVLNMQYSIENDFNNSYTKTYEEKPNEILSEIITEGQKDGTVVEGNPYDLADLYWSMVHMVAFKKVFNNNHEIVSAKQLARLILKEKAIRDRQHEC